MCPKNNTFLRHRTDSNRQCSRRLRQRWFFDSTSAKWTIDKLYSRYHGIRFRGTAIAEYHIGETITASGTDGDTVFNNGYLDISGDTVTARNFIHSSNTARVLNIKNANITIPYSWDYNGILTADSSANSIIKLGSSSNTSVLTAAAGQVYYDVYFTNTAVGAIGTIASNGATFHNVRFDAPNNTVGSTATGGIYNRLSFSGNSNINAITVNTLEFAYLNSYTYKFTSGVTSTINKAWYASGNNCADRYRSEKICKELTEKHGLYFTQGKENVKIYRLKEPDKTKYEIYDALKSTISKCRNWNELKKELQKQGIVTAFKCKGNTNEVQGIMFHKNGYIFNGSKIDRQFSYSKIDYQLNRNEREHDIQTKQEHGHSQSQSSVLESVGAALGGLFDIPSSSGTNYDPDEAEFQRQLKRKKKKQRRPHL